MKRRLIIIVCLIYIGFMAVCFFYLHFHGETFKSIVAIGGIFCGAIPLHMAIFSKWKLNPGIVISYIIFLFGCQFLGTILNWYGLGWWDKVMHFISGEILAFICLVIYEGLIHKNGGNDIAPWFVALITVSFAAFAGVVWEIYEFSTDRLFGTTLQGIGVFDTMTDLMADVAGGLVIAIYGWVRTNIRLQKQKVTSHFRHV